MVGVEESGVTGGDLKVIGVGLSRTGTLSTRAALEHLLDGPCYHGVVPVVEKREHLPLWREAITCGSLSPAAHADLLAGYTAGLDYPFNLFWRQLIALHPEAKVVLTVRDHHRLYRSLHNLFSLYVEGQTWPMSWFNRLLSTPFEFLEMRDTWRSPGLGLTLYQAVMAGEQEAVQFFREWEADVVAGVSPGRLIVFRVQDGWQPLADFLGVACPDQPFPNVNDSGQINMLAFTVKVLAWLFVVCLPLLLAACLVFSSSPALLAAGLGLGLGALGLAIAYHRNTLNAHVAQKGKSE